MTQSEILNARQAAEFLGVHVQTIRKLARGGRIPCFRIGTDWRFRKEALVLWTDAALPTARDTVCSALVVDDDEQVCRGIRRMMEQFGCEVRGATDGEQGLRLLRERAPDLVLLDLVMPGMNGLQFLEKLRATHPRLPVVIVTGYPDSELMQQATRYAPLMLLAKPIKRALLERTVRLAVGDKLAQGATG